MSDGMPLFDVKDLPPMPEPLPSELTSSYDVSTWVAFKSVFRLLQTKGVIVDDDLPALTRFATESVGRMTARGETRRAEAGQMVVDWFSEGAIDSEHSD